MGAAIDRVEIALSNPLEAKELDEDDFVMAAGCSLDRSPKTIRTTNYPPDVEMVAIMSRLGYFSRVVRELGVKRESLRDYLKIRPNLLAAMRAVSNPKALPAEEKIRRDKECRKRWRYRNPEKVREINSRWARNQSPSKRARWNAYNRERRLGAPPSQESIEYESILRKDPCAYCGAVKAIVVDHIIPIPAADDLAAWNSWDNKTAACRSCNARKQARSLIRFLLVGGLRGQSHQAA